MQDLDFPLQDKQLLAYDSPATEILYGGAAFGGKSHLIRVKAITACLEVPGIQCYLFRRVSSDLLKTHLDSVTGFRTMLAPWVADGWVRIKEDCIDFKNKSKIYLCHCQHESDVGKYLSADINFLLMDELTTFTETIYRQLRGRVRMVGLEVPKHLKDQYPRILCGSNPGGVGHHFVKQMWIDNHEPMDIYRAEDDEGGMMRQFIPARLNDNPIGVKADPGYVNRLRGLGSAALVKAMLEGDWNVVEGQYFDCWSEEKHVIKPFKIPDWWTKSISGDWGSARPFSFGWWAVVGEDYDHNSKTLPKGALVRYREWYGSKAHNNVGLKMKNGEIGRGLTELTHEEISYAVLDPSAFSEHGGPSIAEQIYGGAKNEDGKLIAGPYFQPADNTIVAREGSTGGWSEMRNRLLGENGVPMIYSFSTNVDSHRTIPALQHDKAEPERPDTNMEDHAPDEWRYQCMSRPWAADLPEEEKDILQQPTFNDIMKSQRTNRDKQIIL